MKRNWRWSSGLCVNATVAQKTVGGWKAGWARVTVLDNRLPKLNDITLKMEPDEVMVIFDIFLCYFSRLFHSLGVLDNGKCSAAHEQFLLKQPHLAVCALSSPEISAGKQLRRRHLLCLILWFFFRFFWGGALPRPLFPFPLFQEQKQAYVQGVAKGVTVKVRRLKGERVAVHMLILL